MSTTGGDFSTAFKTLRYVVAPSGVGRGFVVTNQRSAAFPGRSNLQLDRTFDDSPHTEYLPLRDC